MSSKQNLDHRTVKQLLNQSLARLGQPTLARLRDARAQALAHHKVPRMVSLHSLVGNITWHSVNTQYKLYLLLATALVIAMLFSIADYQQLSEENDLTEVDISILTDDLPMHVYLD